VETLFEEKLAGNVQQGQIVDTRRGLSKSQGQRESLPKEVSRKKRGLFSEKGGASRKELSRKSCCQKFETEGRRIREIGGGGESLETSPCPCRLIEGYEVKGGED